MRRIKLTKEEREIESAVLRGEYVKASRAKFNEIARALAHHKRTRERILEAEAQIKRGEVVPWSKVKRCHHL